MLHIFKEKCEFNISNLSLFHYSYSSSLSLYHLPQFLPLTGALGLVMEHLPGSMGTSTFHRPPLSSHVVYSYFRSSCNTIYNTTIYLVMFCINSFWLIPTTLDYNYHKINFHYKNYTGIKKIFQHFLFRITGINGFFCSFFV